MQDWTRDFFSAVGLEAWRRAHSAEVTSAEVEVIVELLGLGAGARRVLDVACGDGRHALELARLGHRVTAVDRAADNLGFAQQLMAAAGVSFEFVMADMRALPAFEPFAGAYCWGNSFGYFPRAEMSRFVSGVAERLEPGARFVIDTATCAESLLVELERRTWQRVDDELVLMLECEYDARESRLDTTYTSVLRDQVVDRRTAHHFVFTSSEIAAMLEAAGFEAIEMFGDLELSPFQLGSERLLVVAERS